MTQAIRTIRIATQGPAGPACLYPRASWDVGSVPYARSTVLAHNGVIWLALRSTSVEPSAGVPDDWAAWLDFSGAFAMLGDDGKIPTSQLPASILGALNYQGSWNASTNSPTMPAAALGNKGWYYKVAIAGTTTISGINDWSVGDWIVSNGASWDKIDNTDQVLSVAGLTGSITASGLKTALSIATGDISGLAASATTDATNASNIGSGTLNNARLAGVALTANNLSDLGNAATARTNLGLAALSTLGVGSGLSSGGGNLSAAITSVAGRTGAVTLSAGDVSGLAASATTDATNASNIESGTLNSGRLPSNIPWVLAASAVESAVHTGDTNLTALQTITVPANTLGANGALRITFMMKYTGTNAGKTPSLTFGGTAFYSAISSALALSQKIQVDIINRNVTNSQVGNAATATGTVGGWNQETTSGPTTAAIDTTASQNIVISGQLGSSADSIAVEFYRVEVIKP